jgi:hypothetical protein|tara:strand:+ start:758 stop:1615 length:858 start_codon:yes stop_codon:yes gene_type:complete
MFKSNANMEIVEVTPRLAEVWLKNYNVDNRRVKKNIVDKYAYALSAGQWVVNGDAIRFDINDRLIDGQHRLLAVVKSGIPLQQQLVIRNLPTRAFDTIDDGAMRTASDVIERLGVKNSSAAAAIAKNLILFGRGYGPYHQVQVRLVSKTDIAEFCDDNNEEIQEAIRLAKIAKGGCPIIPAAWGTLLFQVDKLYGAEIAEEFVDGAVNGGGHPNDPRNTIRKWVIRTRADSSGQISGVIQLGHLTKAFNHWVNNKQLVKYIDWVAGKPFPRVGDPVSSGSRNLDV